VGMVDAPLDEQGVARGEVWALTSRRSIAPEADPTGEHRDEQHTHLLRLPRRDRWVAISRQAASA
jgi:hypothetical protein